MSNPQTKDDFNDWDDDFDEDEYEDEPNDWDDVDVSDEDTEFEIFQDF